MEKKLLVQLFSILFLAIIVFSSCNNRGTEIASTKKKPPSSYPDTIVISFPTAVFYNTDSLQLKKLKAITEPGIFQSMEHDCLFQMRYSRKVLTQYYQFVKIIEVQNARWLDLKKADGTDEFIDIDTKMDPCGVFLFDGYKSPILVDMTNIDTELGQYFKKPG
jgi:hypothetical protein